MQILHIYKDYFPEMGGIENHVKLLAEGQVARGHRVTVLVTSRDSDTHSETINGVCVTYAARLFNISSAPISIELGREVGRLHPDIAHLQFPYPPGEIANYFFGHARKTVVTYQSDIVRQKMMSQLYAPLMHRVLARTDRIIATSPNYIASSKVLQRWKQKCVVVPLGINPAPFILPTPAVPPRSSEGRLLFVGRLRYYKGLNYLLQALSEIPDARLTVVGSGPMEIEWKQLASHLGVAPRVSWIGETADENLVGFYRDCDLFVLPASERSEAFGVVQLEAMAAGKPVVSCDVSTGVAWVNQDQVTGLVVPPRDPRALVGAISRLLNDSALRARLGAAGRVRVLDKFTADRMVDHVLQLYASL